MRSRSRTALIVVGILLVSLVPTVAASATHSGAVANRPAYLNPGLAVKRRVADLLSRMTL
jgi:hypothetical protein